MCNGAISKLTICKDSDHEKVLRNVEWLATMAVRSVSRIGRHEPNACPWVKTMEPMNHVHRSIQNKCHMSHCVWLRCTMVFRIFQWWMASWSWIQIVHHPKLQNCSMPFAGDMVIRYRHLPIYHDPAEWWLSEEGAPVLGDVQKSSKPRGQWVEVLA